MVSRMKTIILFRRKRGRENAVLFSFDDMKPYAEEFYSSVAWKTTRDAYKKSVGGLCERCFKKGLITPAEMVHHKTHITPENINDPDITLNWDNLMALCLQCHADIHGNPKRYKVDEFGRITTT